MEKIPNEEPKCRDVICALCEQEYHTITPKEEMEKEFREAFPDWPLDKDILEVCDDCYQMMEGPTPPK